MRRFRQKTRGAMRWGEVVAGRRVVSPCPPPLTAACVLIAVAHDCLDLFFINLFQAQPLMAAGSSARPQSNGFRPVPQLADLAGLGLLTCAVGLSIDQPRSC